MLFIPSLTLFINYGINSISYDYEIKIISHYFGLLIKSKNGNLDLA